MHIGMGTKSSFVICLAALLASSACTKVRQYGVPATEDYGLTIISASIAPLDIEGLGKLEDHNWETTDTIGVYGSEKGSNEIYVPFEKGPLSRFCGEAVKGRLSLYYPYRSEGCLPAARGRMPLRENVEYREDPASFIFSNLTFVAQGEGDNYSFSFPAGIVKLSLAMDISGCRTVRITVSNSSPGYDEYLCGNLATDGSEPLLEDGGRTVSICNIPDKTASEASPLDLYFAAPAGTFENFLISITSSSGESTQICKGPLKVLPRSLTACKVVEYKPEYALGSFGSENGSFN